jgi:hypothetical protein
MTLPPPDVLTLCEAFDWIAERVGEAYVLFLRAGKAGQLDATELVGGRVRAIEPNEFRYVQLVHVDKVLLSREDEEPQLYRVDIPDRDWLANVARPAFRHLLVGRASLERAFPLPVEPEVVNTTEPEPPESEPAPESEPEPEPASAPRKRQTVKRVQFAIVRDIQARGGLSGSTRSSTGWAKLLNRPKSTVKLVLKNFDSLVKEMAGQNWTK